MLLKGSEPSDQALSLGSVTVQHQNRQQSNNNISNRHGHETIHLSINFRSEHLLNICLLNICLPAVYPSVYYSSSYSYSDATPTPAGTPAAPPTSTPTPSPATTVGPACVDGDLRYVSEGLPANPGGATPAQIRQLLKVLQSQVLRSQLRARRS